jgi:hypothetical protein
MKKILLVCILFLSGCSAAIQSHLDDVQTNFANQDFIQSEAQSVKDENNLDLLINGMGLFHANKYQESDSVFEEFNKRHLSETSSSFSREASTLLFGNAVNSYKPYMMDSLFVSYYQLWNLLAMHDFNNARVVINQSYNRQQNMSVEYKKLIEENKSAITEKSEYAEIINENAGDWLAFRDIMNPALMYLSGIYFLNMGDWADAELYLKRASGMMPENKFIKQDLELAKKHQKPKNITWVFSESGFAPRLRERSASFFLPGVGLIYFSVSEPYFDGNAVKPANSQMLANVDELFMTEYSQYRINEILRSYASAVSKAILQASAYNSNDNASLLLGVMATIYTVSSSSAEIRTWATLPKHIYITRITNNKSNLNALDLDDSIKSEIKQNANYLVYKRILGDSTVDTKLINMKK